MNSTLRGRNFLSLKDFTAEEMRLMLETATDLKLKHWRREPHEVLRGKTLAMIFGRPSTRTRVSFEAAMTQLGGHAQFLSAGIGLHAFRENVGQSIEPWRDVAKVVSSMVDGITARVDHEVIMELARHARVPVIGAGEPFAHPCQGVGDFLTIKEKKGKLEGKKLVFAWVNSQHTKPPSFIYDEIVPGARMGMDIVVACPEGYELKNDIEMGQKEAAIHGGSVTVSRSLKEAFEGADAIYVKSWYPPEIVKELKYEAMGEIPHIKTPEKYNEWALTTGLIDQARKNVIIMNAMPFSREDELPNEIAEGPNSVLFEEAENRLHAQKAILALLL